MVTFENITSQMNDLYSRKNADYGDSFKKTFDKFGLLSGLIRLEDKLNRLENIIHKDELKVNESVEDTLLDLANYAVLSLMHYKNGKDKQVQ